MGFLGYKFQGYRFKVFKETQIKVSVSSGTCVGILILKTGLPKDLLCMGCDFDPTPPTFSSKEDFSYFQAKLPSLMSIPFVWDIEDMYGASKKPCQFSRVVGTIKPNGFI